MYGCSPGLSGELLCATKCLQHFRSLISHQPLFAQLGQLSCHSRCSRIPAWDMPVCVDHCDMNTILLLTIIETIASIQIAPILFARYSFSCSGPSRPVLIGGLRFPMWTPFSHIQKPLADLSMQFAIWQNQFCIRLQNERLSAQFRLPDRFNLPFWSFPFCIWFVHYVYIDCRTGCAANELAKQNHDVMTNNALVGYGWTYR